MEQADADAKRRQDDEIAVEPTDRIEHVALGIHARFDQQAASTNGFWIFRDQRCCAAAGAANTNT